MSEQVDTDDVSHMLALGLAATERGEYEAGLQLLGRVYQLTTPEKLPQGLSSYGLCLAKVSGKNRAGAELCEQAIKLQFYEGRHRANLVRVYIAAKNRRKAVQVLEDGLKKTRNDVALVRVRNEIGYRTTPYFRFLRRNHPLNKLYSRSAQRFRSKGPKILLIGTGLLYLAALVMLFFTILD